MVTAACRLTRVDGEAYRRRYDGFSRRQPNPIVDGPDWMGMTENSLKKALQRGCLTMWWGCSVATACMAKFGAAGAMRMRPRSQHPTSTPRPAADCASASMRRWNGSSRVICCVGCSENGPGYRLLPLAGGSGTWMLARFGYRD